MYWICNFDQINYYENTFRKQVLKEHRLWMRVNSRVMVGNIEASVKLNEKKVQKNYLFGKNSYAFCIVPTCNKIENNSLLNLHYAHSIWLGKQLLFEYILFCHSKASDTKCETCFFKQKYCCVRSFQLILSWI